MKSSTYYFHMKTKILPNFQICISVPLKAFNNYSIIMTNKSDVIIISSLQMLLLLLLIFKLTQQATLLNFMFLLNTLTVSKIAPFEDNCICIFSLIRLGSLFTIKPIQDGWLGREAKRLPNKFFLS